MPMHDWTQVEPTIYHHFHQQWTVAIADALNVGLLPPGFSALIEAQCQSVVTAERQSDTILRRANRIAIRHRMSEVVCIIEIVSPGNKASRTALRAFVEKTCDFLSAGVNVLLIDPFPPGPRDPHSLHKVIWDEIEEAPFEMPADEPLLLAAYQSGDDAVGLSPVAYLEPYRVGAVMADMPAWIDPDLYVEVPLERTYQSAWDVCPSDYRYLVEHGRLPDE